MHLIDSGGLYGAEQVILELAAKSVQRGEECTIASIAAPADKQRALVTEAGRRGLDAIEFQLPDGLQLRKFGGVLRACEERGIDVLHTHGYRANILSALSRQPGRYVRVTTLHGWTGVQRLSRLRLYENIERQLLGRFDAVVAVSPSISEHRALRRLSARVSMIPNGINVEVDNERINDEITAFARKRPTILAAGRLSYEKGFDRLIRAFAAVRERHADAQLVIFGDGPERACLQALVEDNGLAGCIRLPGFTNALRSYLPEFHQFVLPSRTEGLPLVLLEAMAAGVPVVATEVGSVPRLLKNGCGLIVPNYRTEAELAKSMSRLLTDKPVCQSMSRSARRRIKAKFSAERMASQYLQLYSDCIEARHEDAVHST